MTPDELSKLIPDEVVEAAARVLHANAEVFHDVLWDDLGDYDQGAYRDEARAAFVAMVESWPGMAHYRGGWEPVIHNNRKPHLILPLTENGNG